MGIMVGQCLGGFLLAHSEAAGLNDCFLILKPFGGANSLSLLVVPCKQMFDLPT